MSSNNPQTREWQALSNDHHLAPFSDFKQLKEKGPRIITDARAFTCGTAKATRSSTAWPACGA